MEFGEFNPSEACRRKKNKMAAGKTKSDQNSSSVNVLFETSAPLTLSRAEKAKQEETGALSTRSSPNISSKSHPKLLEHTLRAESDSSWFLLKTTLGAF